MWKYVTKFWMLQKYTYWIIIFINAYKYQYVRNFPKIWLLIFPLFCFRIKKFLLNITKCSSEMLPNLLYYFIYTYMKTQVVFFHFVQLYFFAYEHHLTSYIWRVILLVKVAAFNNFLFNTLTKNIVTFFRNFDICISV